MTGSRQNITRRILAATALALSAAIMIPWLLRPSGGRTSSRAVSTAPPEVSRTNLVLAGGQLRLMSQSSPFSGFMVEHYANGTLRSRSAISNGLLHGISLGWYTNGQLQVSESFKEGVSHGLRTKWYANGAKLSEAGILAGKLNGTFRRWYDTGVLAEQVELVADRPEGLSLACFPSGFLKARVRMEEGKQVEREFWSDGEVRYSQSISASKPPPEHPLSLQ